MAALCNTDRFVWLARLRVLPLALLMACGDDLCFTPPCLPPTALQLALTAAGAGSDVNATVAVSGVVTSTVECSGACTILGPPGTYTLDISAPGFTTLHQTVEVDGSGSGRCGCIRSNTKLLSLALTPSGS